MEGLVGRQGTSGPCESLRSGWNGGPDGLVGSGLVW